MANVSNYRLGLPLRGIRGLLFVVCCLLFGVWGLGFMVYGLALPLRGIWGLAFEAPIPCPSPER
jgi:hypothetical protein